jgi:hypothetical protein
MMMIMIIIIILTISYTQTSVSKAIDNSSLLGICILSHSQVIVKTTVIINGPKCVLKGFLVTVLYTSWTAVISISHPFCDGG